ncbi:hypothetical protein ACCT03_28055, partial [Rhizobium johnstonii]|uniref:hypothetical protein n=1 Tax=Rhizobium johnstonii TaxID=3019933 RepID=UPI003F95D6FA
ATARGITAPGADKGKLQRWRQPDEGQRHAPAILSSFLDQLTKAHEYLRNDIRNAISPACA